MEVESGACLVVAVRRAQLWTAMASDDGLVSGIEQYKFRPTGRVSEDGVEIWAAD